jgi:hypothetical protein
VSLWDTKGRDAGNRRDLLRFHASFVNQQDRNVVPHRIGPVTFSTLQRRSFIFHPERLLARRADQQIEQFLGDHRWIVLPVDSKRRSSTKKAITPKDTKVHEENSSRILFVDLGVLGGYCTRTTPPIHASPLWVTIDFQVWWSVHGRNHFGWDEDRRRNQS